MKLFNGEVISFQYNGMALSSLSCREETEAGDYRSKRTRRFEDGFEVVTQGRLIEAFPL